MDIATFEPDNEDRPMFEFLWQAANPQGLADLPGATAVPFFQKSQIDKGILRQIWTLSCGQTLNMTKPQFFTAIRYYIY